MAGGERPREKLAEMGVTALSDAELLSCWEPCAGKDVVTYARDLMAEYEGIGGLLAAPAADLLRQQGMGPARVMQLQVVMEISRRYLAWQLRRDDGFTQPAMVRDYLTSQLRHQQRDLRR